MFSWALNNAWFLSSGRACRIMLGRFTDPVLLGDKEALTDIRSAKVMFNNLFACEKCCMTPTADVVTEFLQIRLTAV